MKATFRKSLDFATYNLLTDVMKADFKSVFQKEMSLIFLKNKKSFRSLHFSLDNFKCKEQNEKFLKKSSNRLEVSLHILMTEIKDWFWWTGKKGKWRDRESARSLVTFFAFSSLEDFGVVNELFDFTIKYYFKRRKLLSENMMKDVAGNIVEKLFFFQLKRSFSQHLFGFFILSKFRWKEPNRPYLYRIVFNR